MNFHQLEKHDRANGCVLLLWFHLQLNFFFKFRLNGHNLIPETSYENLDENSMERKVIDMLTDFYTNFAKYAWVQKYILLSLYAEYIQETTWKNGRLIYVSDESFKWKVGRPLFRVASWIHRTFTKVESNKKITIWVSLWQFSQSKRTDQ